jgi:hypothetical protein
MPPSLQQKHYLQSNEEEPYYILKTNNPFLFWVPDGGESPTFGLMTSFHVMSLPVMSFAVTSRP